MKIIFDPNNKTNDMVQCSCCKSVIQYEQSDMKADYEFTGCGTVHWTYIICPKCKHEIQF